MYPLPSKNDLTDTYLSESAGKLKSNYTISISNVIERFEKLNESLLDANVRLMYIKDKIESVDESSGGKPEPVVSNTTIPSSLDRLLNTYERLLYQLKCRVEVIEGFMS